MTSSKSADTISWSYSTSKVELMTRCKLAFILDVIKIHLLSHFGTPTELTWSYSREARRWADNMEKILRGQIKCVLGRWRYSCAREPTGLQGASKWDSSTVGRSVKLESTTIVFKLSETSSKTPNHQKQGCDFQIVMTSPIVRRLRALSSRTVENSVGAERAESLKYGAVPLPTSDTAPFWEATKKHELHMPYCNHCSRYFFYPRSHCRYCDSADIEWRQVSGHGKLISYVINRKPFPEFKIPDPQVIAIVELDEGVNILSQIASEENSPEQLPLGMPLTVVYLERDGETLPFFVPRSNQELTSNA